MKHNFIKKLIATSIITSSIFSMCPATALASGSNYFNAAQTNGQWSKQGGNWYYYVGGKVQKGWIYDITGWYYADQNGVMQTGVIQIGGNIYLLADSGLMQTGKVIINGKVYTARADGALYGDNLPMPAKAFDFYGTNDNVKHPSQVVNSSDDNSSATNPATAYDPLAPREKFQIIYKDDDGEDLKIKNVKDGDTIALYKPTKKGYEFIEWNTKKNGNGDSYDYDDEVKVEKDIKLYAIWEEIEVTDDNAEDLGIVKVEDITIVTEGNKKEITTDKGTLKLSVDVLPVNADNKKVEWSVESETGKATISEKGLLTAEENGIVIVKATAKDGSGVSDTKRIAISGQNADSGSGDGSGNGEPGSGNDGSGSGNGGPGSDGSGSTDGQLPIIKGDEAIVNNSTSTELMKGNTYSTIRIATSGKQTILQNIKANKLIINGGDNIILDNCEVNYIEVLRPGTNCTVTLRNGSTAQIVNVERGVTIAGTGYKKVNINTNEVVTISNGAVIDTVNVTEVISKIKLDGTVTTMNVASSALNSVIEGTGSIGTLVTEATNIKLGVSSVGTIKGNAENTSLGGLINKAKELENITKEVEEAEKANSGNNAALIAKIQTKISETNPVNPYKSEYEKLKFRLEQLNSSNSLTASIKEARNYVQALEKAVEIDPTNTVKLKVLINDQEVKVTVAGDGTAYSVDELKTIAEGKVRALTPGLIDRTNLQKKVDDAQFTITRSKKIKEMVEAIMTSTAGSVANFESNDYKAIGIDNVTDEYVSISNKYVTLLKNNAGFKKIPASISDNDISELIRILNNDRSLIKAQTTKAISILNTKKQIESDINSFNSYIINNGLDTGDAVTISKLDSMRSQIVNMESKLKVLEKEINDGNIKSDDLKVNGQGKGYNELNTSYNECKDKLEKYTIKFMDKNINSLYVTNVISDGNIVADLDAVGISASLTNNQLNEVRKTLNTIRISYSGIVSDSIIGNYITALDKAQTRYDEVQKVLDALNGGIKTNGTVATRTDNGYLLSVKVPTTGYAIDANNCTITSGGTLPLFNVVQTTGGGAELEMKTTVETTNTAYTIAGDATINFKIGKLIITEESGKKNGTIVFSDSNYSTTFEAADSADSSKTYKFNVNVTGKISSGSYVYTVTINRI